MTLRHIPEGRRAQVRTKEWERGVGCTKMVNGEVKKMWGLAGSEKERRE